LYALSGIFLPFYWDTASFLIPAAENITSFSSIVHYTTAMTDYPHTFLLPLTLSLFIKIFSQPLIFIHFFSILISTSFLLFLIKISTNLYKSHNFLGLFLVLSFITNPLFLSQTDLVYFEIVGSLFRYLSIYFLSKDKYKEFSFFSVISFLIRFESGIILPFLGLIHYYFFSRKNKDLLKSVLSISIITTLWFIYHFSFTGWWVYSPDRSFDEKPLFALIDSLKYLFLYQGRFAYTSIILIGIAFLFFKKNKFTKRILKKNSFLILSALSSIPVLIIIVKLGYFIPRYIFPLLLPFYLSIYLILSKITKRNYLAIIIVTITLSTMQILNSHNCYSINFEDCTSIRGLLVSKLSAVSYLEEFSDKTIYVYHEDNNSLLNKTLGYSDTDFNVVTKFNNSIEIIYITPTSDGLLYSNALKHNFKLKKTIRFNNHLCLSPSFLNIDCSTNKNTSLFIFTK